MKPKLLGIVIVIILLLSLIQLVISHGLATSGEQVRLLEAEITSLERENNKLSAEINQVASLSRITAEAEKMGLIKATHVLRLTPEIPVAMSR